MKITYRPEIDGLRALAVISVILYHLPISIQGFQPFNGGFIGVDIFFVISGYLITSIILKELVTTGKFSFQNFYERRIRRILPSLLFVILVSIPFAWKYLLPGSIIDYSKSIIYSLGFSSNFYFWYSGQQYGAESSLIKPFLHTWSLSVEEQYYILFPLIFFIVFKFLRKYLIHILIIGFIISLLLADWGSKNHSSLNFYILPTRGWEVLIGSILAYFEIKIGHRGRKNFSNILLPSLGLILILHSIVFFDDKMFHPSFFTLSPIIGVCLIIWFSNKNELVTQILSTKLFVGLGLISYSLYLWHYPIFAFSLITEFTHDSFIKKILVGLLLISLSIFSYFFVEKPARNKNNNFKIILLTILSLYFVIFILNNNIIKQDGYKERFPKILDIRQKEILRDPLTFKRCNGDEASNDKTCFFNKKSKDKVYLIGDSHTWNIMSDLKDKIINKDFQFITSSYGDCFYFPNFILINDKTKKKYNSCNIRSQYKMLSEEENSIIIFFGRLPLYLNKTYFDNQEGGIEYGDYNRTFVSDIKNLTIENTFEKEVLNLSKKNKIILVYPFPEAGWHVPKKLLSLSNKKDKLKNEYIIPKKYLTTSFKVYENRTKSSFNLLDSIKGNNIYRVYPDKLFCNTQILNRCLTHDDKHIFYTDDDHPSTKAAEMINDLIMKEINNMQLK